MRPPATPTAVLRLLVPAVLVAALVLAPGGAGTAQDNAPPEGASPDGNEGDGGAQTGVGVPGAPRKRNPSENPLPDPLLDETWLERWQEAQETLPALSADQGRTVRPPTSGLDLQVWVEVEDTRRGPQLVAHGASNLPANSFLFLRVRTGHKFTSPWRAYIERDGGFEHPIRMDRRRDREYQVVFRGYYQIEARLEPGQQPIQNGVRRRILEDFGPQRIESVFSFYLGRPADEQVERDLVLDFYQRMLGFPGWEDEPTWEEMAAMSDRELERAFEDGRVGFAAMLEEQNRRAAAPLLEARAEGREPTPVELARWERYRDKWIWQSIRARSELEDYWRLSFAPKFADLRHRMVRWHDVFTKWGMALSNDVHGHEAALGCCRFPRHIEDMLDGTDRMVATDTWRERIGRARAGVRAELERRRSADGEARLELAALLDDLEAAMAPVGDAWLAARDRSPEAAGPGPWGETPLLDFPAEVDGRPFDPATAGRSARVEHAELNVPTWLHVTTRPRREAERLIRANPGFVDNVAAVLWGEETADAIRALPDRVSDAVQAATRDTYREYGLLDTPDDPNGEDPDAAPPEPDWPDARRAVEAALAALRERVGLDDDGADGDGDGR